MTSTTPVTSTRKLFALSCVGLLTFGVVLTTLGSVLPSLVTRFGIDKAEAGALLALMSFGIIAGSIVMGPVVDRRGYRDMLAISMALIALGLEGIAVAPSLAVLRVAILAIGFGGGIVNGGTNALVADIHTEDKNAKLMLLGVFFGVGAVGVPFALGVLSSSTFFTPARILAIIGALVIVPIVITLLAVFPAPKQPQGVPLAAVGKLLREPFLLFMGLLAFLESGVEITVGGWTATFFKEELALTDARALGYLALYWTGMTVARLVIGTVFSRRSPLAIVFSCIAIALVGSLLLLGTHVVALAALGVFLLGVGFSATFPTLLGFVGERYAGLSGTAFSIIIVMALMGGMALPWTTGVLGTTYGLRTSFLIVPGALVVLASLLAAVSRRLTVQPQVNAV